jgi:hypothetical protein
MVKNLFDNQEVPKKCRGILYICEYNYKTFELKVVNYRMYSNAQAALEAYSNIPNPESQLAMGNTYEKLEAEHNTLKENIENPEWRKELAEYL